MLKLKLNKTHDKYFIELDETLIDLLDWSLNDEIQTNIDDGSLILKKAPTQELPPPIPDEQESHISNNKKNPRRGVFVEDEEMEFYWALAAERQEREKFMSTLRPFLRAKYGYDYTEVLCEKEAKKLCRKYYRTKEEGGVWTGPHWPDIG